MKNRLEACGMMLALFPTRSFGVAQQTALAACNYKYMHVTEQLFACHRNRRLSVKMHVPLEAFDVLVLFYDTDFWSGV